MRRLFVTAVVLACRASVALPASAAAPKLSKDLWATINVCDTLRHDNMMGVRASMPGDGAHTKMYMRFTAQYYDRAKQLWTEVGGQRRLEVDLRRLRASRAPPRRLHVRVRPTDDGRYVHPCAARSTTSGRMAAGSCATRTC